MSDWDRVERDASEAAERLVAALGRPHLGVVLGSGFSAVAASLGEPAASIGFDEVPGLVAPSVDGHVARISSFALDGGTTWVFGGRLHLYEGHSVSRVVQAVRVLRHSGAGAVLLTCAAGGLRDGDRAGDLLLVEDHLNLTGVDPIAAIPPERRQPPFPDLQGIYDGEFLAGWRKSAGDHAGDLRQGVLAAVHGPCYETPAEIRMLRALGADAVTMSTVPESIVARYLGLRVAALACVANPGAGLAPGRLRHRDVVAAVASSAADRGAFFGRGIAAMLASVGR